MALVDLWLIASEPSDYANPIEPSARDGEKIARAIAAFAATTPSVPPRSDVWT